MITRLARLTGPFGQAARSAQSSLQAAKGFAPPGRRHLLLVAPSLGLAAWAASAHGGGVRCDTSTSPVAAAVLPQPPEALSEPRAHVPLWRVLWRLAALICHFTPVIIASPWCWLLWSRGGESVFWQLVLGALQAHGPIAVKFAQWASTRPDLLPTSVCGHFSTLQAAVRPHAYKHTVETLNQAFGPDWTEVLEIDPTPIGSGCMAQVYEGQLLTHGQKGRKVALKVRHPRAQEKAELDLAVMRTFARTVEALWPSARYLALSEAVEHFAAFVQPQADLRVEAGNLEVFAENFEYGKTGRGVRVRFPRVIRPYVAESALLETFEAAAPLQAVLCQEAGSGADMVHPSAAAAGNIPPGMSRAAVQESLGRLCMDFFLKMLFKDNFIHGDLHPGNILFRFPPGPGPPGPELILLDAGLAVQLSRQDRRNFVELFHAIAVNDGRLAGQLMAERSPGDRSRVIDEDGFVSRVANLVGHFRGQGVSLGKVRLGDIFSELLGLALQHRVQLETCFVKVATSIIVLEGVGRQLNPVVDLMVAARPMLVDAVTEKLW